MTSDEPLPEPLARFLEDPWFRFAVCAASAKDVASFDSPTLTRAGLSALQTAVISLARDVAVLREMLSSRGLWDDDEYRERRINMTINDHGGPGPAPWRGHAVYPHTLDDERYLHEVLRADPDELARFRNAISDREMMT